MRSTIHRIALKEIYGTPFIALADDNYLTPIADLEGSIAIEKEIMNIPEVQQLGPHDLVLDIGAFVGDTALIFGARGATVIAFEPYLDAALCAIYNTRGCSNITIHHEAIGDGSFYSLGENPLDGNLGSRALVKGADYQSTRLDYIVFESLTFIKIDCEGYEPFVLNGAVGAIRQWKPKILVEIHHEMLAKQGFTADYILALMKDLGYTYRCVVGKENEPRYDLLFTPQ